MAWNKYYIFVKSPKLRDAKEILTKLNLGQYKPIKEVPLYYSNNQKHYLQGFIMTAF